MNRIDSPPRYRGRFAPSPTGPLHFGSLVAAFASWLFARQAGGEWLVRIEDLDPPREVPGAARRQLETLKAFGLDSDRPVLWQSRRDEFYRNALETLIRGDRTFACRCSRADLASVGGVHRQCVQGGRARGPALRFRVPEDTVVAFDDRIQGRFEQQVDAEVGDFPLRRANGPWAYHLAVVVDDAEQGITEVVRGADLLDSTPRQILLQSALSLPNPAYAHVPLALDEHGEKLGKSSAAAPVDGNDPLPALRVAWRFLGQDARALVDFTSVRAALAIAQTAFRAECIPRARVLTADRTIDSG